MALRIGAMCGKPEGNQEMAKLEPIYHSYRASSGIGRIFAIAILKTTKTSKGVDAKVFNMEFLENRVVPPR